MNGVFIPACIVQSVDFKAYVPMLNMNGESVYVTNFVLSGKTVLNEIVKEFQDVFYVKGDLLTVTNMIEHEVP